MSCKCEICDREFSIMRALCKHISCYHDIDPKLYYDKYLKKEDEGFCKMCGKETTFKSFSKGYNTYCGPSCGNSDPLIKEQKRKTNNERYGCDNPMQSEDIKSKYRKNYLDKHGVENPFQNEEVKDKIKETNLEKFGCENPSSSDEIKQKKTNTCRKNHCVDHPMQSSDVREKSKKTCIDKYGCENPSQNEEIKKKKAATSLSNFGKENPFQSEEVKDKIRETNLERYGVENPSSSEKIKEKKRQTTFSHYGVYVPYKNKEIKEKGFNTLRKNGSFNTSEPEEDLYKLLSDKFGASDIERQYKDKERYPFFCDFYIKSTDTFIELNAFWTHSDHFFDENNKEDIELLEEWKSKTKGNDFYSSAIEVWTVNDLKKRDIALKNNLNYVVFWNLSDAKEWLRSL